MDARVRHLACIAPLALLLIGFALRAGAQPADGQRVASIQLPPGATGPFRPGSLQSGSQQSGALAGQVPGGVPLYSAEEMEATKIIARVGDQVVLAGDLYAQVNQFLAARLKAIPAEHRNQITDELIRTRRWQLIKQVLPTVVDGKLIYLDFLRSIPAEKVPEIQDSLFKAFDEQQLPVLVERARADNDKVKSAADVDAMLRGLGSSLEQQRRTFAEQLAAAQWKQQASRSTAEISHEDMLAYYREHIEDYRIQGKVRWEQLSALDSKTFSREASRNAVATMGNEVWRGASFAAVAKRSSHGPTASLGGNYDWTTRGSLRSEVLDEAIFVLPPGELSRILEDDDGCHIVRVIERQDESLIPFAEAQSGIRDKIRIERLNAAEDAYVEKLRSEFTVWTLFDDNPNYPGN